ncbi:hypothetical protein SBX64_06280 [Vibrio rhizosphaerae]|uniref:Pyruvate carboxyltransferase domain-containing protein n=1 Tax=Vibrio rhizosphaerae TaxID=398736 RepID=A0ABU4IV12_9VIBR|nr:hypothetical protein [Vibrio rhizosphaerae]MDW6092149.1 hypothetical protein [Vibrio rhizosphaerae]
MTTLIDCTLRDGGNYNDWNFSLEEINSLISYSDKIGIEFIELGYIGGSGSVKPNKTGPVFDLSESFIENLPEVNHSKYALMIVPAAIRSQNSVQSKNTLEQLKPSKIDMIRVASYAKDIDYSLAYLQQISKHKKKTVFNLMAVSNNSIKEVIYTAEKARDSGADIFYIADSFGALSPNEVSQVISQLNQVDGIQIGFHGHNNLGCALINAIAAMQSGATYIDCSITGLARGAGNLATEQIIIALNQWPEMKQFQSGQYDIDTATKAVNYIYNKIIQTPITLGYRELKSGLLNLHYNSKELTQKIEEELNESMF